MNASFLPDLFSEISFSRTNGIYVLTGEHGIGKHTLMKKTESEIRKTDCKQIVLSVEPDEFGFSLWPIEKAITEERPDMIDIIQDKRNDLNYIERLTKCFVNMYSEDQRITVFLYHVQEYNDDLWHFIKRLFRIFLCSSISADICFCCCLDTDETGHALNTYKSYTEIVAFLSRFCSHTRYFHFVSWPKEELERLLLQELFDNRLSITSQQKDTIISAAMGNPGNLITIVEQLKSRGMIYGTRDNFFCMDFDWSVLQKIGEIPVNVQYESLEAPLRDLLRGSSVIGVEFESKLLSNPLEFHSVNDKIKQLLAVSRIIHQKIDDLYQFDTVFARLSIRAYVSDTEFIIWNRKLGDYFWNLSRYEISIGKTAESLNSLKKCAFYYDQGKENDKAVFIYDQIARKLMTIMQYADAIDILIRIRELYSFSPNGLQSKSYAKTWLLQGDCHRYRSEFSKAIFAYENYLMLSNDSQIEKLDIQCTYYSTIYESGEIQRPLAFFRELLSYLEKQEDEQLVTIKFKVLVSLSIIEETICDPNNSLHYNAALDIAKKNRLEKEYYSLLCKALIVHHGLYGIRLMESAKEYYHENGELKEYAKVMFNIAAELLLYGDLEVAKDYYEKSRKIILSYGGEILFVPLNGLGDYWCLKGEFELALECYRQAYSENIDAFSRIAIAINTATAYRKLGKYEDAAKYLFSAEQTFLNGDAKEFAILMPQIQLNKAILLYETGNDTEAFPIFLENLQEQPFHGKKFACLSAMYVKKIYEKNRTTVPENILSTLCMATDAEERLLQYGITIVRLSITE